MKPLLPIIIVATGFISGCGPNRSDMPNRNNRNKVDLSHIDLAAIPDSTVQDSIFNVVLASIGKDYDREHSIVARLPVGYQTIFTTIYLEAEVNNGGFNQYFWNTSGQYASQTVDDLRRIGADSTAILLEEAIAVALKEEELRERFKSQGTLEAFSESYKYTDLGQLDKAFFGSKEDLSALRIAFVRNHPELFKPE